MMIVLNSGNKGNMEALNVGWGFRPGTVEYIRNNILTAEELEIVEKVWDLLDTLYPHLNEVHKELTGVTLPKVEGRYFPLKFDRELSWKVRKYEADDDLRDMFASPFTRPTVEAGHRKTRKGGKMAPRLDFGVIAEHITSAVHDSTHQVPIRSLQRIFNHPKFRQAVVDTMGRRTYEQLLPWLQDVARPRAAPKTRVEKFWGHIRKNTTTVGLGAKVSVAMKQILSLTQTIDELGLIPTLVGLSEFYSNPRKMMEFINQSSAMIRNRRQQWDRELAQFAANFDPTKIKGLEEVRDAFFWMIGVMDIAATGPTWLASYNVHIKTMSHEEAVRAADRTVRRTQPVASPKDLSMLQRGGAGRSELHKLFTMFYTFFAVFQNRMMEISAKRRLGNINMVEAFVSYWWIWIFPALLSGIIQKRRLETPGEMLQGLISYWLAGLPFIRDVVTPMSAKFIHDWVDDGVKFYGYSMSPVAGAGEAAVRFVGALGAEEDRGKKVLVSGIRVSGYAFGLPSAQMAITVQGAFDLAEGETDNPFRLLFSEEKRKKRRERR
jgi:hypothetical protein